MINLLDKEKIEKCNIMVIGDFILDKYLFGNVNRISPEAPVPVFNYKNESKVLGGAGNVVSNLIGLGCNVIAIGTYGDDKEGETLNRLLENGRVKNCLVKDPNRPTITKTRVVSNNYQLLRIDKEEIFPLHLEIRHGILYKIMDNIKSSNIIILSDYNKGILKTNYLSEAIIKLAKKYNIPVIVDPKGKDWNLYKYSTCITPNTKELETIYKSEIVNDNELEKAGNYVLGKYELEKLLVTRGPLGMCIFERNNKPFYIPALTKEVYDVSGAGDTVISALSIGLATGLTFKESSKLANIAASIVISKFGTQPVSFLELKSAITTNGKTSSKIFQLQHAIDRIKLLKMENKKITFTNGCFDLLHPGHIKILSKAKEMGDFLIVGLNSDSSIRRLKGKNRPIVDEHNRALILASLDYVDMVVIFEEDNPIELIKSFKPDVLVKGADYKKKEVVGKKFIESYGGKVNIIPLLKGYSTTNIVKNMKEK